MCIVLVLLYLFHHYSLWYFSDTLCSFFRSADGKNFVEQWLSSLQNWYLESPLATLYILLLRIILLCFSAPDAKTYRWREDIKTQKNEKMKKEQKEEQRNFEAALNGFVLPEVSRLIVLIAKQGQCWTRPAALRVVEDTFILINQSTTTFVDIIWYRIVHFVPLWFWTSTLLLACVYMVSFAVYI